MERSLTCVQPRPPRGCVSAQVYLEPRRRYDAVFTLSQLLAPRRSTRSGLAGTAADLADTATATATACREFGIVQDGLNARWCRPRRSPGGPCRESAPPSRTAARPTT